MVSRTAGLRSDELCQLRRAFSDALSQIERRVKYQRFLQERTSCIDVASFDHEERKRPDRIGEIEDFCIQVLTVDGDRLCKQRPGLFRVAILPIDVTQVSRSVRDHEWITMMATQSKSIGVMLLSLVQMSAIALYLTKANERGNKMLFQSR